VSIVHILKLIIGAGRKGSHLSMVLDDATRIMLGITAPQVDLESSSRGRPRTDSAAGKKMRSEWNG
jgi:hypothetical protein